MRIGQAFAWFVGLALGAVAPTVPAGEVHEFPIRPVRLVVPFPPGGAADLAARLIVERWEVKLGGRIVIENRSGAAGTIGMDAVAKARPDGYTIGLNSLPLAVNPTLHRAMPYDTLRDLVPIGTVATTSLVVVVNPAVKAATLGELVALTRARPGRISFAAAGIGGNVQLATALFREFSEPKVLAVQYRGDGPALAELVGGQVDAAVVAVPAALPHIRAGRLRALATVGAERSPALPGVPTAAESDVRVPAFSTWFVVVAPAGTPRAVVDRLNHTLDETLREPDLVDRMNHFGLEPWVSSPEETDAFVRAELLRWARMIRERGLVTGQATRAYAEQEETT
jgi:tripartite-type tricarboxylate transporter receptor subunit TctC